MFQIQATKRDNSIKGDALRKEGKMPAVYYSAGKEANGVSLSLNEFKKIWRDAGESSPVKLMGVGSTQGVDVLIHEVQVDPVTNEPIHADFLVVDINKPVRVSLHLEFEGVAPAVKNGVGSLVKVMHEIEVEALPKDLPHSLSLDISSLVDAESQLTVADIKTPVGVKILLKPEEIVASIALQKEEKEEVPVDLSAIEVEKKGKKEEEGSAEATA